MFASVRGAVMIAAALLLPCAASAIEFTQREGAHVVNGVIVESYAGRCTSPQHYGKPWRVWFTSRDGWRYEGPQGSGATYSTPVPEALARKVCEENQ